MGSQAFEDFLLQHPAQIEIRQFRVAVFVASHRCQGREILGTHDLCDTLREDGDTVLPSLAQPLDDRARQNVGDLRQPDRSLLELLRYHRERGPCGFPDAQREVAGLAAHGHDKKPMGSRARIFEKALDGLRTHVSGRLKAERRHALRKIEVVIDSLGNVNDPQASLGRPFE